MKTIANNQLRTRVAAQTSLVLLLALASVHALAGHHDEMKKMPADIVDVAVDAGQFNTLAAAISAAGLVDTLRGEGPFAVFAPTDAAFDKLPAGTVEKLLMPENRDKLIAILSYHVVAGKVMVAEVVGLDSARTVNGADLAITVNNGSVSINQANVMKTDILARNGVIHVIDEVVMPPAS